MRTCVPLVLLAASASALRLNLGGVRRVIAAGLAPASLFGASVLPTLSGTTAPATVVQRVQELARPKAAFADNPADEDAELEDTMEFFAGAVEQAGQPEKKNRFRLWFFRRPWSQRDLEEKLKIVPVFMITNGNGDPYFIPVKGANAQVGKFYLDPRDAQEVLDEFLQDAGFESARLSVVSMARAMDIMTESADQNEDNQDEELLEMGDEIRELANDIDEEFLSAQGRQEEARRQVKMMKRARLMTLDEQTDLLTEDEELPLILWDFVGSLRSLEAMADATGGNTAALLTEQPAYVYYIEGIKTRRGGEDVTPYFFDLADLRRAYFDVVQSMDPDEIPDELPNIKAVELEDVLKAMLIGGEDWSSISLEPMYEAKKFVRRAKKYTTPGAHLDEPADIIGRRS